MKLGEVIFNLDVQKQALLWTSENKNINWRKIDIWSSELDGFPINALTDHKPVPPLVAALAAYSISTSLYLFMSVK